MNKKTQKTNQFPEYIMQKWEASDCVNFAIALSRITNWILHVDWWSPTDNKEAVENMTPLRVHVGNNLNHIYDIRGKQTISTYTNNILTPIYKKRAGKTGGIVTRYYSEQKLLDLPLRIKPDELKINEAHEFIVNNKLFLSKIQLRGEPLVPAHIAAKFTFGYCNPFATALFELKGYKPIALIAKEYNKTFNLSELGYVHSFVFDQNNNSIDIWGKDTIDNIALRFGVTKYELSENEHFAVNDRLKKNYPEKYNKIYEESVAIISEFF